MLALQPEFFEHPIRDELALAQSHNNFISRLNRTYKMNENIISNIRPALADDAKNLAKLIDIAGEGVPN